MFLSFRPVCSIDNPWDKSVSEELNVQKTWAELLEEAKARRNEPPAYDFPADSQTNELRYVSGAKLKTNM